MLSHKPGKKIDFENKLRETERRLEEAKHSIDPSSRSRMQERIQEEIIALTELRETLITSIEMKREMIAFYGKEGWDTSSDSSPESKRTAITGEMDERSPPDALYPPLGITRPPLKDMLNINTPPTPKQIEKSSLSWRFFKKCCLCCGHPDEAKEPLLKR